MLERSFVHPPATTEKQVQVRILKPIYVAGQLCEADTVMAIAKSDALVLRASQPPTVEILA